MLTYTTGSLLGTSPIVGMLNLAIRDTVGEVTDSEVEDAVMVLEARVVKEVCEASIVVVERRALKPKRARMKLKIAVVGV